MMKIFRLPILRRDEAARIGCRVDGRLALVCGRRLERIREVDPAAIVFEPMETRRLPSAE